jgi:hypothetical protein
MRTKCSAYPMLLDMNTLTPIEPKQTKQRR